MWQERISRLIEARAGLVLSQGTKERLGGFVARRCAALGIATPESYVRNLEAHQNAAEFQEIINTVTVSKTSFFRYTKQIDAVCQQLLPALDRALDANKPIHIWSAAVSTGEEPYSLAIALEHFGWFARRSITLLGTDINDVSLARARRGEYQLDGHARERLPHYAWKYFELAGSEQHFRVAERVRARVQLVHANLNALALPSEPRFHVVLCCNVLIYFDETNRRRVISDIQSRMAEQSALLLGGAEISAPSGPDYRVHDVAGCFAHLRGRWPGLLVSDIGELAPPAPIPVRSTRPPAVGSAPSRPLAEPPRAPPLAPAPATPRPEQQEWRARVRALMDANRFDQVLRLLESIREQDPFCEDAHFLHGRALRALGRREEAEGAFRRAVFLDPDFALARYELGLLRHLQGDFEAAAREYQRALGALATRSTRVARAAVARDAEDAQGIEKFVEHTCIQNRELALAGVLPDSRAGPS